MEYRPGWYKCNGGNRLKVDTNLSDGGLDCNEVET